MSTIAIGLIAIFAIFSISQAAPSTVISTDEESTALEPIASLQQACRVSVNFGIGQVSICPEGGCDRVNVLVNIPSVVNVNVDVAACRSGSGKYNS